MARKIHISWLVLCALLGIASTCKSSNLLSTTPDYYWDSQNFGSGLCIVRINSDGYADVVGSYLGGGARYLMNDGPNWNWCKFNPQSGGSIEFGASQMKADIIYGVWDHLDVAMVGNSTIRIYENNRDGSLVLEDEMTIPESGSASWMDLGKVNSDVYPDMVVTALNPEKVYVYQQNNQPIPSEPTQDISVSLEPQQIQLAHLENDGSGETMVVAADQFLHFYINDWEEYEPYYYYDTWNMRITIGTEGNPVIDFAIADLDADLDLDIVACSATEINVLQHYIYVSGLGGFNSIQIISLENIKQVALGELNYDGYPDLAVATSSEMIIYLNDQTGHFLINQTPPAWWYTNLGSDFGGSCYMNELQFADLRGLGSQSLVFSARGNASGAIGVFKNIGNSPICPVRNFSVSDGQPGEHPNLIWLRNEELDADHYDIYRALMPEETPPSEEDFELLATVDHPDTSYLDTTVTIHTQYDNYKIWYAAKAVDTADQESPWSSFVRFWGYYENNGSNLAPWMNSVPESRLCLSAAPNPFNNETHLIYSLPAASLIRLQILDVAGRVVADLQEGWAEAGEHTLSLDSKTLPSGKYFARLSANGGFAVTQLTILK